MPLPRRLFTILLAVSLLVQPLAASAQVGNNRIFVLDQELLYNQSAFGRRVRQTIQSRSEVISRENLRLENELKAEELSLTEQRPNLSQAEFRELADAFDAKVEAIRTAQAGKTADLNRFAETERQRFFDAMLPVLVGLAEEIGALAIIDTRTTIISSDLINITERAIARIDAEIGDGGAPPPPVPSPPITPPPVAEP